MIQHERHRRCLILALLALGAVSALLFVPQLVRTAPNAISRPTVLSQPTPPILDLPIAAPGSTKADPMRAEIPAIPPPTRFAIVLGYQPDHPSTPDPVEFGTSTLEITLVDADTDAPIESSIDLWRIGAPGNENWVEGDQRIGRFKVGLAGLRIPDLPAGRFRIVILRQTSALPDPEPFEVKGELTCLRLPVSRPRPLPVWIDLWDESGSRVTEKPRISIQRTASEGDLLNRSIADRPWVQARRKRDPEAGVSNTSGGGLGVSVFSPLVRGPELDGFRIDDLATSSVAGSPRHKFTCRVRGLEPCIAEVLGTDTGDARRFVGVCVRQSSIAERLSYRADWSSEDRQRIAKAVTLESTALSRAQNPRADAFLDVPIRVTLDDPACASVDFVFTLRAGLPEIAIEPRRR